MNSDLLVYPIDIYKHYIYGVPLATVYIFCSGHRVRYIGGSFARWPGDRIPQSVDGIWEAASNGGGKIYKSTTQQEVGNSMR